MTRKYVRKADAIPFDVSFESVEPEPIYYNVGNIHATLTGFLATLYRGMIWMYGEDIAQARFWAMFHTNENSVSRQENAVSSL